MSKLRLSKVKLTVIFGYTLVVIVLIFGLTALYSNLVDFSNKRIENEDLTELILIGNTLSVLYEVESEQNMLTSSNAKKYLLKYDSIIPIVKGNLEKLDSLSQDSLRKVKLDTINYLIGTKKENLNSIVLLLDSLDKGPDIISETHSSYEPRSNLSVQPIDENMNPSKNDTILIAKEKKGLLERLRNVFVANPDSTIIIESRQNVIDTVVNKVLYSERLDLSRQLKLQTALFEQQNIMSHTNGILTVKIDNLLKEIEQEELRKSIELIQDKETTLAQSQKTMRIVSAIAILIAILFALLFLIDINRSQRYKEKLEESNQKISELLTTREKLMLTISHDIKAPTSSILGFIDLMKDRLVGKSRDKKSIDYLQNMKSSANHIIQLVSTLLDYYKLQGGQWSVRNSNFVLYNIVKSTLDSFRPIAEQKNLNYIVTNSIPKEKVFYGDQYALRQIISNIISNAIKYTSSGEIKVFALEQSLNKFYLSVKDTGIGIDIDDQKYIFNEFKQLDGISKNNINIEGSGLGLAITKNLVSNLQGDISLISEKGVGSEFVVEIPLKSEDLTQNIQDNTTSYFSEELELISVLVIDDDPIQVKMVTEMIKKMGMKCIAESDPENVVEILKNNRFNIALIDINLQVTTGVELVKNITEKDKMLLENIPLIALSAGSDISKTGIKDSGFVDFLPKPFTYNELFDMILRHVNKYIRGGQVLTMDVEEPAKGVLALVEFVEDDEKLSLEILNTFIVETKTSYMLLEEAFEESDFVSAGKITHKMLPLFKMIRNDQIIDIMELLEKEKPITEDQQMVMLNEVNRNILQATELKNRFTGK